MVPGPIPDPGPEFFLVLRSFAWPGRKYEMFNSTVVWTVSTALHCMCIECVRVERAPGVPIC
jgi:hypothetical protein